MTDSLRWLNSRVTRHTGAFDDMRRHIPSFERRPFALSDPAHEHFRQNLRLDTVVRRPHDDDRDYVPVGVVSKDYALLPHTAVFDAAVEAFDDAGIDPASVTADLRITELGERMSLGLDLPDNYLFDPGDKFPMTVRLECLNSVDGSTRFRASMGWFRLVCSNGMGFGITQSEANRRHVGDLQLAHIGDVLGAGLTDYKAERKNMTRWMGCDVSLDAISDWADSDVLRAWGFKAATRAFHISHCGRDAAVRGPYKHRLPTTVPVRLTNDVPGSEGEATNLFDASQVLAWLAKERRDLQEQVEWREQIPALVNALEVRARSLVPA
ncbi:MAG: DUF932 domain-containing protein [Vicinamibacterales bacterium]